MRKDCKWNVVSIHAVAKKVGTFMVWVQIYIIHLETESTADICC